jgi:N-hydroxyarylamine O-acetyltransferase
MKKEQYLNRIKYYGKLEPNISVLTKLQSAHLFNVPFENLDIHNKIPIKLIIDKIFEKIVIKNRGGFCYELNGLFNELLISLNFNTKLVSARVYNSNKTYSPEFDHLAIIVKIGDIEFLTDVGFGDFTFTPLKLELGTIQNDGNESYIIDKYDDEYFRVNKIVKGKLIPEYIFKNLERNLTDFIGMCEYHQSNPDSHFMKNRLISIPTKSGRITISGNNLKVTENNSVQERLLKDEIEFNKQLWKLFKIKMKE